MNKNALKPRSSKEQKKVKTITGKIPDSVGYRPPVDGGYTMPYRERHRLQKEGIKKMRGY